jgi:hypothetical protein
MFQTEIIRRIDHDHADAPAKGVRKSGIEERSTPHSLGIDEKSLFHPNAQFALQGRRQVVNKSLGERAMLNVPITHETSVLEGHEIDLLACSLGPRGCKIMASLTPYFKKQDTCRFSASGFAVRHTCSRFSTGIARPQNSLENNLSVRTTPLTLR